MTDGGNQGNMTSNDAIETYAPDPSVFQTSISRKLETNAGLDRPSCGRRLSSVDSPGDRDFVSAITKAANRAPARLPSNVST